MKIKRVIRRLWAWSFPTLVTTMFLFTVARTVVFAQLSPGDILVVDQVDPFRTVLGGLFRVDPVSGNRTLFSDFSNAAQGLPLPRFTSGQVAIEASGDILVLGGDEIAGEIAGGLFRVDPVSGNRILLSDFGNAALGPVGALEPSGMAVEASGDILVVDQGPRGGLFRVDPVSGNRILLSDFGNAAQGPLGINPFAVAVEASGDILVVDFRAAPPGALPVASALGHVGGQGLLFRVDPVSGNRILLSDFSNAAQGPLRGGPFGVAVFLGPVLQRIKFPQLALGGGYELALIISNETDEAWEGQALLREGNNEAWSTPWAVNATDKTGASQFDIFLDPRQMWLWPFSTTFFLTANSWILRERLPVWRQRPSPSRWKKRRS